MSSQSLPVINISTFIDESTYEARVATARYIADACSEYGFFYLTGHGVAPTTTARILSLARTFFTTTSAESKASIKRTNTSAGGDGARGYQEIGSNVTGGKSDWHEAVDFYGPWGSSGEEEVEGQNGVLTGKNKWPHEPQELREEYEAYIEAMKKLGTAVVRAMGWGLREIEGDNKMDEETFVKRSDKSFWVMRMIGYPPLPDHSRGSSVDNDDAAHFSCGTHTDYGCVTLLLTDKTKSALQVQMKDGTWINVDPIPGAFVVNIGDFMEKWTGGRWKSTKHRVIHRSAEYRVSVPFFFEPNWDAPSTSFVGKDQQKELTYGEHLIGKVLTNFY